MAKRLPAVGGPGPINDLSAWVQAARERLDGRPVVVSVSGGKDSTATALLLMEAGIPFRSVHFDTGWEHADTVAYVREYLPGVIGPIQVLQGNHGGMVDLVRKRGMFPSRVRRFCTQELKVRPFQRFLRRLQEAGDDPVNAVGIRAAESRARRDLPEWDENARFDCEVWRPLIGWSEQDVIAMHTRHGVLPNPLYLRGATRVGCWPCIFARKAEIRQLADQDPERIDLLDALEEELAEAARLRAEARGEAPKYGREDYGWFRNPRRRSSRNPEAPASLPIRKVVEWSRTARGGRQVELFAPDPADAGCMRWGLCEAHAPESA